MEIWGTITPTEAWEQLDLFFANDEERATWNIVFFLNTVQSNFLKWLDDKIYYKRTTYKPIATLPEGEIFIEGADVDDEGAFRMWIHGVFVEKIRQPRGPAKTVKYRLGTIVFIKALVLTENRIEVTAICYSPKLIGFFRELLAEIGRAWPESELERTHGHYLRQHPMLARRRPNADRDEYIYSQFMAGKTRQELADASALSEERIKQIIREQREKLTG